MTISVSVAATPGHLRRFLQVNGVRTIPPGLNMASAFDMLSSYFEPVQAAIPGCVHFLLYFKINFFIFKRYFNNSLIFNVSLIYRVAYHVDLPPLTAMSEPLYIGGTFPTNQIDGKVKVYLGVGWSTILPCDIV